MELGAISTMLSSTVKESRFVIFRGRVDFLVGSVVSGLFFGGSGGEAFLVWVLAFLAAAAAISFAFFFSNLVLSFISSRSFFWSSRVSCWISLSTLRSSFCWSCFSLSSSWSVFLRDLR